MSAANTNLPTRLLQIALRSEEDAHSEAAEALSRAEQAKAALEAMRKAHDAIETRAARLVQALDEVRAAMLAHLPPMSLSATESLRLVVGATDGPEINAVGRFFRRGKV
ncbi:hypothetical protein AB4099_34985 [Bosea sp. 2KB_26]|uniref:hypothetical protein n=1 Tax=Bosea sp. 2KB_26 TaxID=3237475 RepID=UPI003F91C503